MKPLACTATAVDVTSMCVTAPLNLLYQSGSLQDDIDQAEHNVPDRREIFCWKDANLRRVALRLIVEVFWDVYLLIGSKLNPDSRSTYLWQCG